MASKNYTDIFDIKAMYMTDIAPKYFDVKKINTLNVGLYGQVNETMATTTEDVFNTIATYTNELIPIRATLPSSIYGYATSVQLEDLFAKPAKMGLALFIGIENIINENTRRGNKYIFNLDRSLEIFIEDIKFMLDYDIMITAKPYRGRFIYSAQYILDHENAVSDIKNPYIKAAEISYSGAKYLALILDAHQMTRYVQEENIINNTILNAPVIDFSFEGEQLAGFNVFYKDPTVDKSIQLKLLPASSPPIKEPFCYYRFKNDYEMEISFSTRDFYFKPELNSDLIIEYMTTLGVKGEFEKYTGVKINTIPKSEKWDYNNNLIMFAITNTGSEFGRDMPTLEQIKALYIEKMTTVGSYTSDEDLNIHFKNFTDMTNNVTRFIKTRDDVFRIYSGYGIIKDRYKRVYPTNTVDTVFSTTDFDNDAVANIHILKPGRLFTYKGASNNEVTVKTGLSIKDNITAFLKENEFVYTNPFMMMISKNPSSVGYYLNSVDRTIVTDYKYVNGDSLAQFICGGFSIFRSAHDGSSKYTIRATLTPVMDLDEEIVDSSGQPTDVLKPILMTCDTDGNHYAYTEFKVVKYNKGEKKIEIEASVNTDDVITLTRKFQVKNLYELESNTKKDLYIPMVDCIVDLMVFYKHDSGNTNHDINIPAYREYTLTNIYRTVDEKVDWITPLSSMNSHFTFMPGASIADYKISIKNIPMVKASIMKDPAKSKDFIYRIWAQQRFIREALPKITNNFSIDIKFYNTYGRARNMTVGEDMSTLLDKVNLKLNFLIKPNPGTPVDDLVRDLKIFIQNYVEDINAEIFNSFHISNLIRHIENAFPDIDYLNFQKINNYDSNTQTIVPKYIELETMPKDIKSNFVPEYLTVDVNDITLTII